MSESLPDKCPFCGANYHGEGKTDEWEWVQYKCSTEFENGEWLQDDECRIAQLEATLTARESELAEAQRRVAELEDMHRKIVDGIEWTMTNIADDMRCATPETDPWCKSLKRVHDLLVAVRKALLPPARITHIPGKEGDDGEMQ